MSIEKTMVIVFNNVTNVILLNHNNNKKMSHNKGKHPSQYVSKEGLAKMALTHFKSVSVEHHPSYKGGIQNPKNDCYYVAVTNNVRKRKPRVIWELYNGPIPVGMVIVHKDGNRYNDNIDNLMCITRAELIKLNNPLR